MNTLKVDWETLRLRAEETPGPLAHLKHEAELLVIAEVERRRDEEIDLDIAQTCDAAVTCLLDLLRTMCRLFGNRSAEAEGLRDMCRALDELRETTSHHLRNNSSVETHVVVRAPDTRRKMPPGVVCCGIEETTLSGDYVDEVDSVQATCGECGHVTESYGTLEASEKRCLAVMREECPRGAKNFYTTCDHLN